MNHLQATTDSKKVKIFCGTQNIQQKRERLERLVHQLIPDKLNPLINSSMDFYRKQFNFPINLHRTDPQSSSSSLSLTPHSEKIDFSELLKLTRQELSLYKPRSPPHVGADVEVDMEVRNQQYGPFSLLFDYYGLYLPMPLDLGGKERNNFQHSIFELKIPMIVESMNEKPKTQTLHNLRFLNFNFDNSRVGYVINGYKFLLEGNYGQCLSCIDSLTRNRSDNFMNEDYLIYYMKGLCYFLLEDYEKALNHCEECINIMMKRDNQSFMEKLNGKISNTPIRLQPILLYVWILYKMFEFSHAEMVLAMCTEEIFPFNAEAHFNMAQFLVGVHGRKASSEIVQRIGNHLKKALELYMNMGIFISNNQIPNNSYLEYYPQNMYNSIFKYFNYYLHFLQTYNFPNESRQLISIFLYFANDVLNSFGVSIKVDLKGESAQYHKYNSWKPIINHPIELAFMFVSAARFLANSDKEKAKYMYQIASDLELLSYKEFNSPNFCLAFHCKICGCLELFSIVREHKEFVNKQV